MSGEKTVSRYKEGTGVQKARGELQDASLACEGIGDFLDVIAARKFLKDAMKKEKRSTTGLKQDRGTGGRR